MTASIELDWLKKWDLYSPKNIAIKDGETGRELSYAQLFEMANRGSQYLRGTFGISKGDRVAVLATNELEYVILFFALQRLGAIMVPVNFRLTQREVDHIITDSAPKLVICQEAFIGILEKLPTSVKAEKLLLQGPHSFAEEILKASAEVYPFVPEETDPVMILYTSGTTGSPKGAILTHKMIFWNSINTTFRLNISQTDCTVSFLPFFHTGGWNVLTTPFIHRGAKVVILKKFDAEQILLLSEKEKATILFGVPTTMDMMVRSPLFAKSDLSSIRYSIVGGEPMPIELIKVWDKKGIPIRQGYGLTEFGPSVFSLNEEDALRKIGSIGFPNFYVEAKVVDNEGHELGADEIGELVLKGPACMQGYWHNEKATKETIKDGWLYTGDLVRRDSEGYYYVVGRKKEMFISGGENVYPVELEQVLRACPGVLEVAVIGVPDEKWGEVGKAFIVRQHESVLTQHLLDHCLQNLAKFKIPKHFIFLDALPKGDSGKILKRKLQELA
ncbi:class I adenylate-forming enzyme family protein [Bdellovibrio svalbardensis]|uniref:Long-chain fatty acid--CoA ligase n=1 Tax=Bdellovibrio svalbardensis TaxID=2972972 RepID=A0ABT6DKD5_9BACT|nr:long-chain fatty acid--CoA ligase [Bdellovibrio svalbardensis]MDG0817273.1 long-chain fatty acid--CoA ligase [Bdellovibrio svalbardensis]